MLEEKTSSEMTIRKLSAWVESAAQCRQSTQGTSRVRGHMEKQAANIMEQNILTFPFANFQFID